MERVWNARDHSHARIAETHAVPGSKSYTNRALTIAALARGRVRCTARWRATIRTWRVKPQAPRLTVEQDGSTFVVHGHQGEFIDPQQPLFLGNSGTATRFFTAMLTLAGFPCTITGNARMQERPIADLLER